MAVLACAAAVYAIVYADLVLRARSAYLEGERHMRWHERPEEKKAFHDRELQERAERLSADLAAGRIDRDTHDLKLELARFQAEEAVRESSLKYATVWFQSAAELFTPPESRWVVRARARMAEAKELWKEELRAKGIPFEDYMLE
jgi:hypothetical protein